MTWRVGFYCRPFITTTSQKTL